MERARRVCGGGGREWARTGRPQNVRAYTVPTFRAKASPTGHPMLVSSIRAVRAKISRCNSRCWETRGTGACFANFEGSRINMLHERLQIPQRGFAKEHYLEHLLRKDVFVCICHPNAHHATLLLIPLPKHLRSTSWCRGNIWQGSSHGNLGELEGSPLRRRSAIYVRHFPYV
jgi:hypothetical protein